MKYLSIRQKIVLMIAGFLVSMSVSFVFAWNAARPLRAEWSSYLEQVAKRNDLLMDMSVAFGYGGLIHNFMNYLLRGQEKYEQASRDNASRLKTAIESYRGLGNLDSLEQTALADLETVSAQYIQQLRHISQMRASGGPISDVDSRVKTDDSPAFQAFDRLHDRYVALTHEKTQGMDAGVDRIAVVLAWVLVPSGMIGILIMLWVSRSIRHPITRFTDTIEQVHQTNDLSFRVEMDVRDELSRASDAFDHMLAQFTEIVDQVNHSANGLAGEIERFSSAAEGTRHGMDSQRMETEQIATAMNEMAATVQEVARNAESAAQAAAQANDTSGQGNSEVQDRLNY